jgi:O-acetyl-ADP-ribose deacetylase (regulator of RNase III)
MLKFVHGDMFEVPAEIRVNTVNCVGVMGAGVALAFKTRYPEMFRSYKKACEVGAVRPGALHEWKTLTEWVVNFPTKRHWRDKSRYDDIASGLATLRNYLKSLGPVRVALPALGCGHGGLEWTRVSEMIDETLGDLDARIFVFEPADSVAVGLQVAQREKAQSKAAEISLDTLPATLASHRASLRQSGIETAFVLGTPRLLSESSLAVILSAKPDEREEEAALACVRAISRPGVTLALRHGGRVARLLCEESLKRDAQVILCVSEGIDRVHLSSELSKVLDLGRVTIASVARRTDRWTPTNADRAELLQIELAQAALITAPAPEWPPPGLHHSGRAHRIAVFYVRYGDRASGALDRLRDVGAQAVGRDAKTGLPRTAPVLAALGLST